MLCLAIFGGEQSCRDRRVSFPQGSDQEGRGSTSGRTERTTRHGEECEEIEGTEREADKECM